jgi:hypothetical protein
MNTAPPQMRSAVEKTQQNAAGEEGYGNAVGNGAETDVMKGRENQQQRTDQNKQGYRG